VGYLVLSTQNKNRTIGEMQRMALFDVRPIFASLPGVSAPPPFGGSQRTIVLKVDPTLMDAKGVSLQDVIAALNTGNTISPSGNIYIEDEMPIVRVNAVPTDFKELGNIPLRPGSSVCLRDIGEVKDATDIPTGYALVNGQRTVYLLVTKRADASTLAVVNAVRQNMDRMQKVLPEDVRIRLEFDQSPYVTRAMWGVGIEGALGALLAMLCILAVFLPSFFMQGAARNLFVPLALAVGFSMVTSYLLSSTFVPVLSVWLLRHYHETHASGRLSFERFRAGYAAFLQRV